MRGSLSLAEIEGRVQQPSVPNGHTENQTPTSDKSAFNSLLMSMKNAGQLPEKPSPIVSQSFDYVKYSYEHLTTRYSVVYKIMGHW